MKRRFLLPLSVCAAAVLTAATFASRTTPPADLGTTDANITRVTAHLLEDSQFSHHPLDNELAAKFLDRYLDALDPSRVLFLQSDIESFAPFRATLARATRRAGDTEAARVIFARYMERLREQTDYVTNTLATAKFDFTGHDTFALDREKAGRPVDLKAARALWWQQLRAEYLQEKLGDKKPAEIVKTLDRRQEQLLHNMKDLGPGDVLEIYLNALAHVYDPHSDYFGHEQMDNFAISMNLSLCGIGATLQSEDGACKISDLVPGGPAARSGLLKPGDRIIAVAQAGKPAVDIMNMPLWHAVELIRGPKGTVVHLTIIPANAADDSIHKTITLVRDQIKLEDEQAKASLIEWPAGNGKTERLGVIDLPSFYGDVGENQGPHRSCSEDVALLLTKLKKENVRGVILDLRHNGGGSLQEAINLTGLFIPAGPVVQTRGPDGDMELGSSADSSPLYEGPLVVLTSRNSASASEIVAGALQDHGRALIVGDTSTFGKGTVQTIVSLASIMDRNHLGHAVDPGALKVTIRKFYRPSGASTQLRGVASDIVLPSPTDESDVNESSLKDPLPWDTVPAAEFTPLDLVQPYLSILRAESFRRISHEKDFGYLRDEIAELKKSQAKKTVSLNEAERRKELAEDKARQANFDKEAAAENPKVPTYDITLEAARQPGLGKKETSAAPDIILTEAEHILVDYAKLLGHKSEVVLGDRRS